MMEMVLPRRHISKVGHGTKGTFGIIVCGAGAGL